MKISDDQRFMEFNLQNGYRYQERGNASDSSTEYIRLGFSSFKKLFDMSALQKQTTNDSIYRGNFKMLSVNQLNHSIDSLQRTSDTLAQRMSRELDVYAYYTNIPDSIWKKIPEQKAPDRKYIADSAQNAVYESAVTMAGNMRASLEGSGTTISNYQKEIRQSNIEWHRKFSLSLACLVLFFIGAPLGSIIRKGGLGMPLVVAIIFFLLFHLLNMFGEKFVKESITSPFTGMWLSVLVLIPVGMFFTYKAMHDSQLFNKEFYYRFFKKIRPLFGIFSKRKQSSV